MKFLEYIKTLVPVLRRYDLLADIEGLREEVNEQSLAPFFGVTEIYADRPLLSSINQGRSKAMNDYDRSWPRSNFLPRLKELLESLPSKLDVMEDHVRRFGKDVTPESLNYQRAAVLKYLEAVRFFVEYSRTLLTDVVAAEDLAAQGKTSQKPMIGTPAEREMFEKDWLAYLQVAKVLALPADQVDRALKSIPDVAISEDTEISLAAANGSTKLDPLRLGFVAPRFNPILHFRTDRALAQVTNYQLRKEEIRQLEFRLLNLRARLGGQQPDPRTEKAIRVYEQAVSALRQKQKSFEQRYMN